MSEKKVTIYDIAEKTGFSVATVNRALSNKPRISPSTRQLIIDTAKELGYKANIAAQGLRRTPIKIGAILFCPIEEYIDSIIDGIHSSAIDLEKYNVKVDIKKIAYTNNNDCIIKTIELIKTFSHSNYNGIVLFMSSTVDELHDISSLINELSDKNIYTATVANDISNSTRALYVGIDAFMAGKMAAEILELSCKGKDVALLTGSMSTNIHTDYIEGFKEYSKNNVFNSIKIYEHFDNKAKIIDVTNRMLDDNPNLKGIYMASASSGIACEHIRKLNIKNLSIVTTDLLKETPELLNDKIATTTIFQNPYRQGRNVVKLLYNYITKGTDGGVNLIAPQILMSSNLEAFLNNKNL